MSLFCSFSVVEESDDTNSCRAGRGYLRICFFPALMSETWVWFGVVTACAQQCPALPGQGSLISCWGPWWSSTAAQNKEILWTVYCLFWVNVLFSGSRLFLWAISGFDCWSSFSLLPSSPCLGWKRGGLNAHWTVVLNLASPWALLRNLHFHAGGRIHVNLNDLSKFSLNKSKAVACHSSHCAGTEDSQNVVLDKGRTLCRASIFI